MVIFNNIYDIIIIAIIVVLLILGQKNKNKVLYRILQIVAIVIMIAHIIYEVCI